MIDRLRLRILRHLQDCYVTPRIRPFPRWCRPTLRILDFLARR